MLTNSWTSKETYNRWATWFFYFFLSPPKAISVSVKKKCICLHSLCECRSLTCAGIACHSRGRTRKRCDVWRPLTSRRRRKPFEDASHKQISIYAAQPSHPSRMSSICSRHIYKIKKRGGGTSWNLIPASSSVWLHCNISAKSALTCWSVDLSPGGLSITLAT